MRVWKELTGLLAVLLVVAAVAMGDDTNSNNSGGGNDQGTGMGTDQLENPTPTPPAPAAAPTEGPLMLGLDKIGVGKTMESWGLNAYGYIEGGYLYDLTTPNDQTPGKTAPGDDILFAGPYKNALMLNQIDLAIERAIDASKGNWDIGFKVEFGYGRDDYYTHSNGILDQSNKSGGVDGPDDQPDLLQAYLTFAIPVGNGITVQAGKFESVLGVESINPSLNIFYTHSYEFTYGSPFTLTGVLGKYTFTDSANETSTTITAGITRSWNQTLYNDNGDPDGLLEMSVVTGDLTYGANVYFGPMGVLPYGPSDDTDWWIIPEANVTYKATDAFTLAGDFLYGEAPHLPVPNVPTSQQSGFNWFSLALYATYAFDPHVSAGLRLEYYHDGHGVTTGVGGSDVNYFEATTGLQIHPLPGDEIFGSLTFRPELRFDEADAAVFDPSPPLFLGKYTEVTAAIDVYWKF
jgi:Putative beta-barrel porin-2, OmpL-like. bbp2